MSTNQPSSNTSATVNGDNTTTQTFDVRNRTVSDKQLTLEQLMRDAQNFIEIPPDGTLRSIQTQEEFQDYKLNKRKEFKQIVTGRGKDFLGKYIQFARWEAQIKEFDRAREIFETALGLDPHNSELWLHYANTELACGAVQQARNIFHRATQALPYHIHLWKKWLYLEEKLGNTDNCRTIYKNMIAPRLDPTTKPHPDIFDQYLSFELKNRNFSECLNIYELYIKSHPSPATYIKYAQFAMGSGKHIDLLTHAVSFPAEFATFRQFLLSKYGPNASNHAAQYDIFTRSKNNFVKMYHTSLFSGGTANNHKNISNDPNYNAQIMQQLLHATPQQQTHPYQINGAHSLQLLLTPALIFERCIYDTNLLTTLAKQYGFEESHHKLLLTQLEMTNQTTTTTIIQNNTITTTDNNNITANNITRNKNSPQHLAPHLLTTHSQLLTLHKQLPEPALIESALKMFLVWASLEEKLVNQQAYFDYKKGRGNSNVVANDLTSTQQDVARPREVLYFLYDITPQSRRELILDELKRFEKRHGDSVMIDLSLLYDNRIKYQISLGISYTSLAAMIDQNTLLLNTTTTSVVSGNQHNVNEHIISTSTATNRPNTSLQQSTMISLLNQVRDYDTWLEWAKVEQYYVEEQVKLYQHYTNNIATYNKSLNPSNYFGDPRNHENPQDALFFQVPSQLSYLHADVVGVYRSAQRLLPISIFSTQNNNQTVALSIEKSDWKRFIYLFINHALYEEIYNQNYIAALSIYQRLIAVIPHHFFTFSSVWVNYAYLQLRAAMLPADGDGSSSMGNSHDEPHWEGSYLSAVEAVRSIFKQGVDHAKLLLQRNILAARQQQQQQQQHSNKFSSYHNKPPKLNVNLKLFLAFINFEQQIQCHDKVRELFNSFVKSVKSSYRLWKEYVVFEASLNQIERTRILFHLVLGLVNPKSPQHVSVTQPPALITTPAELNDMWNLYVLFERQLLDEENQLITASQQYSQRVAELSTPQRITPLPPPDPLHNPIQLMTPYIQHILPDILPVVMVYHQWIISDPFNPLPYISLSLLFGHYGQALNSLHPPSQTPGPSVTLSPALSVTLLESKLLHTTQPFYSTIIPQCTDLSSFCLTMGRFTLAIHHRTVCEEITRLSRLTDKASAEMDTVAHNINEHHLNAMPTTTTQPGYDIAPTLDSDDDPRIQQYSRELFELLYSFRSLTEQLYVYKVKRRDIIASLYGFEMSYGSVESSMAVRKLTPTSLKKSRYVMYPRVSGEDSASQQALSSGMTDNVSTPDNQEPPQQVSRDSAMYDASRLHTASIILKQHWVMEKQQYDDLVFPQDETAKKSNIAALRAIAKKKKDAATHTNGTPAIENDAELQPTSIIVPDTAITMSDNLPFN